MPDGCGAQEKRSAHVTTDASNIQPVRPAAIGDGPAEAVLVAVSGSANGVRLVKAAALLAAAMNASWEAIHVETPDPGEQVEDPEATAEALSLAARLGAGIATIPAATVADGIESHLVNSPATHLVLGRRRTRGIARYWRRSVGEMLVERYPGIALHMLPLVCDDPVRRQSFGTGGDAPGLHYAVAFALVSITVVVAVLLQRLTGMRGLDLLFLLPAIGVSARLGLRPGLFTVVLSVLGYNFFLLRPRYSLDFTAPENLVVLVMLLGVSAYVSMLTTRLRGRVALSDRSARENAGLAAFALRLTGLADWQGTAQAVCEQVATSLKVHAMLFREIDGELVVAGAVPSSIELSPLSRAALDWAWNHGEPAGNGTEHLGAAEWRFEPLKTSLGTLAILAIARDNGGEPVRADQLVLYSTLVAQASLAHERLRLEDVMKASEARLCPPRLGSP